MSAPRKSRSFPTGGDCWVASMQFDNECQVSLSFGRLDGFGQWERWMSVSYARDIAAALIAAADHYDEETERLAGGAA